LSLVYHFVWGPMRARPVLVGAAAERLIGLIQEKADLLGVRLRRLEIRPNRVYVVVEAPPQVSPHSIICGFKAHSSGTLRQEFRELTTIPTLWTRDYVVVAGETVAPEHVCDLFEALQPPRRPRGRPRAGCDSTPKEGEGGCLR